LFLDKLHQRYKGRVEQVSADTPSPNDNGAEVSEPLELIFRFSLDARFNLLIAWVLPASKHEVMPNEQTASILR
jgi:hypothetical protein